MKIQSNEKRLSETMRQYLSEGRIHEHLTRDELAQKLVMTAHGQADEITEERWKILEDLWCEVDIRGVATEDLYHMVKDDYDRIRAKISD